MASRADRRPGAALGALIAGLAALIALTACAAGAPTVASDPTSTSRPATVRSSIPVPTSTIRSTVEPTQVPTDTPRPTRTPKPTRTPDLGPTPRPEPPANDGSGLSQIYESGTSGRPEVALTFDAGADRGYAEQILDTLEQDGVVASFGITGMWAAQNPDLVKRMVDDGHMLFNHTYDHQSFTGVSTGLEPVASRADRQEELNSTEKIIRDLTDYQVAPYFRPPYGDIDDSVLADVADAGYWITLGWTCDSLGWNGASVDDIIDRCGTSASPGDIILMHVGSDSLDADALPGLIEAIQANDLNFVTIEELLQD